MKERLEDYQSPHLRDDGYPGGGNLFDASRHTIQVDVSTHPSKLADESLFHLRSYVFSGSTEYGELLYLQLMGGPNKLIELLPLLPSLGFSYESMEPSLVAFVKSLVKRLACRRMVRTEAGYLALIPGSTRIGDRICILFGSTAPFVLRPIEDKHLLVGQCYVHGVMKGEVLKDGYEAQIFHLV